MLNSCSYCDEITIVRKSSIRKLPKAERQIKHRKSRSVISAGFHVLVCCCVVFANLLCVISNRRMSSQPFLHLLSFHFISPWIQPHPELLFVPAAHIVAQILVLKNILDLNLAERNSLNVIRLLRVVITPSVTSLLRE